MTFNEYISKNKIDIMFEDYDNDRLFVQVYKNKQDMFVAFGMCEFINYMDWFYDTKVEFDERDSRRGYVISNLTKKEITQAIQMFMYEYKF